MFLFWLPLVFHGSISSTILVAPTTTAIAIIISIITTTINTLHVVILSTIAILTSVASCAQVLQALIQMSISAEANLRSLAAWVLAIYLQANHFAHQVAAKLLQLVLIHSTATELQVQMQVRLVTTTTTRTKMGTTSYRSNKDYTTTAAITNNNHTLATVAAP